MHEETSGFTVKHAILALTYLAFFEDTTMLKKIVWGLGLMFCVASASADLPDAEKLGALKRALTDKMNEYKLLVNVGGRCLETPPDQAKNNGGRVQLWDCHNGDFQRWKLEEGRLKNAGGKCLDVSGPDLHKNGGHVGLWDCNDAPNQQWSFNAGRLRNGGGKCLDIPGVPNWNSNGTDVKIWDCNEAPNQKWEHRLK